MARGSDTVSPVLVSFPRKRGKVGMGASSLANCPHPSSPPQAGEGVNACHDAASNVRSILLPPLAGEGRDGGVVVASQLPPPQPSPAGGGGSERVSRCDKQLAGQFSFPRSRGKVGMGASSSSLAYCPHPSPPPQAGEGVGRSSLCPLCFSARRRVSALLQGTSDLYETCHHAACGAKHSPPRHETRILAP